MQRIKQIKKGNNAGFTLIELLLVVGLLAISIGVTSDILVSLIRSYTKSKIINKIEQNANYFSQKFEKEIRNSTRVTAIGSDTTLDDHPGGNSITFIDRDNLPIVYALDTNNNKLTRTYNGSTVDLTTGSSVGGITVTCVTAGACFKIIEDVPQVVSIKIQFQQSGTASSNIFTGNVVIDNTIVIRNTY